MAGMDREEAEKAFMEAEDLLWEKFSKKIKALVAVQDVAKKDERKKVNAPLQESSDYNPWPSASRFEQSKLASKGKFTPKELSPSKAKLHKSILSCLSQLEGIDQKNAEEKELEKELDKMEIEDEPSTEPAAEVTFKEWIEKLEARVQDLSKRSELLPQEIHQELDEYFASVLNQVKGLESWTETQIVNSSYQYYQELEAAIKEAQDSLQDLLAASGIKQDMKNTRHEAAEVVISIQQEFLQLLEQKETARKKLLTLNRSKLCWNCHSTKNLMCEDCMRAKYCSEECQEERRTGRGTMTGATRSSRGGMRGTRRSRTRN